MAILLGNPSKTTATATTVASMFFDRVQASTNREAFRYLVADEWISATWQQSADRVEPLADVAIMCSGAATTTIYSSTNASDTAFILADSECRILFAEDSEQLAKVTAHRAELPDLTKVVLFDGVGDGDWVITLSDLVDLGREYLRELPHGYTRGPRSPA